MNGPWEAQLGIAGSSWKGNYCKGKPCGAFLIWRDLQHASQRFYDAEGKGPTGTWEEWFRTPGDWCSAVGRMSSEGEEGEWTKKLENSSTPLSKGEYVHGHKVGPWVYDCGEGKPRQVDHGQWLDGGSLVADPCPEADPCRALPER
jgi:hypothetical protein